MQSQLAGGTGDRALHSLAVPFALAAAVIHSRSLHVHIHSPIHHQVTLSVLLESFSLLLMANASHRYIPYINNQIARTKPTEGVTIR